MKFFVGDLAIAGYFGRTSSALQDAFVGETHLLISINWAGGHVTFAARQGPSWPS
jgi:hypothetical protein